MGISPSPFDSKSNQGYVRVGHGPECHSKPWDATSPIGLGLIGLGVNTFLGFV